MTADDFVRAILSTASRHLWPAIALTFALVFAVALTTQGPRPR